MTNGFRNQTPKTGINQNCDSTRTNNTPTATTRIVEFIYRAETCDDLNF